jgi:hypothetical protein
MGKWLIVLPMLYATALAAAPAWTWVDADGRRHYSDRPVPGAEQIELSGAQGFTSAPPTARQGTPQAQEQGAAPADPGLAYRSFTIVSPAQEETLWNIGGNLSVAVAMEPGLQRGHRLDAYLDGQRVVTAATSLQFSIPDVFRGLHTLQAVIADADGREVRRSPTVTFMVQQTSVINPN